MKHLFLLLLSSILFYSCEREDIDTPLKANHVLVVYMAADNDLSFDALKNLEQIKKAYRSATISLIDPSELEALAAEIKKILTENSTDFSSFDRASVQRLDVYNEQYHFDLSDFFNKIFPNADKSAFEEQLKKTVLYKANTPQFIEMYDIETYCGLSCYIPFDNRPDLNRYYSDLGWSIDSGMNQLLNR
jgi:hypothetical protein